MAAIIHMCTYACCLHRHYAHQRATDAINSTMVKDDVKRHTRNTRQLAEEQRVLEQLYEVRTQPQLGTASRVAAHNVAASMVPCCRVTCATCAAHTSTLLFQHAAVMMVVCWDGIVLILAGRDQAAASCSHCVRVRGTGSCPESQDAGSGGLQQGGATHQG